MRTLFLTSLAATGLMAGQGLAQTMGAPPTSAYQGGVGSPSSTQATNIQPNGQVLGSRLPNPETESDRPEALLRAALRALDRRQTGAAQQALEMAETRELSRTTLPSRADQPAPQAIVQHISAARQALGRRDVAAARAEIRMAMASPQVPRGPTITQPPPAYGGPGYPPAAYAAPPAYMPPGPVAPGPAYATPSNLTPVPPGAAYASPAYPAGPGYPPAAYASPPAYVPPGPAGAPPAYATPSNLTPVPPGAAYASPPVPVMPRQY